MQPLPATMPGLVLAWRQDGNGAWRAVVVIDLPAAAVRPRRTPEPPGSD